MKIIYLHQYFILPSEPGGTRSYWNSIELLKNGHEVTVITSSSKISQKKIVVNIDGLNIIYLRVKYNQKMHIWQRFYAFFSFMLLASLECLKIKKIDLVFATSTPLSIGFPALILKWLKNVPFIFEVRDLWPEVPIQMGGLNNPILQYLARLFEKTIYKHASHVIALSPGMEAGVLQYIDSSKSTVIPNMAKIDEFFPRERNKQLLLDLGLNLNSFKLIHFGSLGLANGAKTIIESAILLNNDPSIEFVFIGGGATEIELQQMVAENNLKNVYFLGAFPMKQTSEIVNLCDASIVSFKDLPILYTNSPNKLFDSLSAGKPIIVNSAGWTRELVENADCGFYVNPNNPTDLVEKLYAIKNDPTLCRNMGANSRKLAVEKFDKKILCQKFVQTIEKTYLINLKHEGN